MKTAARVLRGTSWALPFLLLATLVLTYVLAPGFYVAHVIQIDRREGQILERVTFGCALLAAFLLAWASLRLARRGPRLAATLMGIAAAAFFFAGEEVSWGQSLIGWRTPESYRPYAVETNLHNTDLPVNQLGGLFLICVFVLLPLAWHFRARLRVPDSIAPAVPSGPVVSTMAVAFLWRFVKGLYRSTRGEDRAYVDFFEQINEHKEMLVAVGLLLYAVDCVLHSRNRTERAASVDRAAGATETTEK
jgi:hypothetical protein